MLSPNKKSILAKLFAFLFFTVGFPLLALGQVNTSFKTANNQHIDLQVSHYYADSVLISQFLFRVKAPYHLNANGVEQDFLIPTRAQIAAAKQPSMLSLLWQNASLGIVETIAGQPVKIYQSKEGGGRDHYAITIHSSVNPAHSKRDADNLNIQVPRLHIEQSFSYQPCDDEVCYPPQTLTQTSLIDLSLLAPPPATVKNLANLTTSRWDSLLLQCLLALLAGLLLNFMPCVFPVLSLKIYAATQLYKQNSTSISIGKLPHKSTIFDNRSRPLASFRLRFWDQLGYFIGVCLTFLALATLVTGVKLGSQQLGWGFQFQQPTYLVVMAVLIWFVGMEISGFTSLQKFSTPFFSWLAQQVTKRLPSATQAKAENNFSTIDNSRGMPTKDLFHAFVSSVGLGVITVLLSTPCTAPFFTSMMAYAFSKPLAEIYLLFFLLSIGFASPMFACLHPFVAKVLQRILPKSGAWLEKGKLLLGLMMFATSTWLASLLFTNYREVFPQTLLLAVFFFSLLLFKTKKKPNGQAPLFLSVVKIIVVAIPIGLFFAYTPLGKKSFSAVYTVFSASTATNSDENANSYNLFSNAAVLSAESLEQAIESEKPLLVIVTADWCLSCKWNERRVLHTAKTAKLLKEVDALVLVGDITTSNLFVEQWMHRLGFVGIPLYLVYSGKNAVPQVLPVLLRFSTLREALVLASKNKKNP